MYIDLLSTSDDGRIPDTMSTQDASAADKWAFFWAWQYRRAHILCMFSELGKSVALVRDAVHFWKQTHSHDCYKLAVDVCMGE